MARSEDTILIFHMVLHRILCRNIFVTGILR